MKDYKEGIKASIFSITVNVVLATIKLGAGVISKSQAMTADGIHTLSDVGVTLVSMTGLKISSKKADKKYPYGYEKFELIFAQMLSIILFIVGIFIGYEGIMTLINKDFEVPGVWALIVALISVLFKEVIYRYTMSVAKKIGSVSMEADAWHHRSDALSSIGTFIGVLGARLGFPILDPIAAVIVAFMVIRIGVELYLKSVRGLVDESADDETINKVREIALAVEGVFDIADLKTKTFSGKVYVDMKICVDETLTVKEGYNITTNINNTVKKELKDVKECHVYIQACTVK